MILIPFLKITYPKEVADARLASAIFCLPERAAYTI
jgi:hypothetical protein